MRQSGDGAVNQLGEQDLGLFGSPEDAALLDEVVALAYADRRRPSRRDAAL